MPRFARLVLLLGFLILAAPAHAAVITLALEGSVDLSFFGGPSASTFAASMTWDSTVDPSRVDDMAGGTVAAYYQLVSTSVSLNANDVTNEFASPTLTLFDQPDVPKPPCCPARDHLVVEFPVPFPYLALGNGPGTLSLVEVQLSGLPTMSDSHALPSDVSFLDQLTGASVTLFSTYPGGNDPYYLRFAGDVSSISASERPTSVPGPGTAALTAVALAALLARRLHRHSTR
jgi:hypothetical protein